MPSKYFGHLRTPENMGPRYDPLVREVILDYCTEMNWAPVEIAYRPPDVWTVYERGGRTVSVQLYGHGGDHMYFVNLDRFPRHLQQALTKLLNRDPPLTHPAPRVVPTPVPIPPPDDASVIEGEYREVTPPQKQLKAKDSKDGNQVGGRAATKWLKWRKE